MPPRNKNACDHAALLWPVLLAAASAMLLGYFLGRDSYRRDLRAAARRIAESSEPIAVTMRA